MTVELCGRPTVFSESSNPAADQGDESNLSGIIEEPVGPPMAH
jgi:hypothetical protein